VCKDTGKVVRKPFTQVIPDDFIYILVCISNHDAIPGIVFDLLFTCPEFLEVFLTKICNSRLFLCTYISSDLKYFIP